MIAVGSHFIFIMYLMETTFAARDNSNDGKLICNAQLYTRRTKLETSFSYLWRNWMCFRVVEFFFKLIFKYINI